MHRRIRFIAVRYKLHLKGDLDRSGFGLDVKQTNRERKSHLFSGLSVRA